MKKYLFFSIAMWFSFNHAIAQIAFKHTATPGSINQNVSAISNPATDNKPNSILIVTPDFGSSGPYHNKAIGVWYSGGKWTVFNQDRSNMTVNAKFNVLVLEKGPNSFMHTANVSNISGHITTIDHPRLNNQPNAKILITQNWGSAGPYNNHPLGVYFYDGKWRIYNQNRSPLPVNAKFNVHIDNRTFAVEATAPNNNWYKFRNAQTDKKPNVLVFATQNWTGVYNPNEIGVWYNSDAWTVFNQNRSSLPRNSKFHVLAIENNGRDPVVIIHGLDSVILDTLLRPRKLRGFVDMHTHPMSHLGFGKKIMHGAPDIGSIIPAGTRNCNPTDYRARSIEDALGHCNSTHGGWGEGNGCGDYIRAIAISKALDENFKYNVDHNPFGGGNLHGDHRHEGIETSPNFTYWPHQSSVTHQQMWWEWIKRAYQEGGLRVMVALAVNNELLAEVVGGDSPRDDKTSSDLQINEIKSFVGRHSDFMEVAYNSKDLRRIVSANKLAVIIGVEVDNIGNFNKPGVISNESTVRAEIQRLYNNGVRYIFPIHLADNKFGGAAVYEDLFNYVNKYSTGSFFNIQSSLSVDPDISYRLGSGLDGAGNLAIKAALDAASGLPFPPAINFPDCFFPIPTLGCWNRFQIISNLLAPDPLYITYAAHPGGHVNQKGLHTLGEIAIQEMMRLGMMIDIDHMSQKSINDALTLCEKPENRYPLNMGHNGIRETGSKERFASRSTVERLATLGGVFGVGTANTDAPTFIQAYNKAWTAMGEKAVGMGTDVNGMERLPNRSQGLNSEKFYDGFPKCRTGNRTWDYTEEGVAHYGLIADFVRDIKIKNNTVFENLMNSAEYFAQMWEKCEERSRTISGRR